MKDWFKQMSDQLEGALSGAFSSTTTTRETREHTSSGSTAGRHYVVTQNTDEQIIIAIDVPGFRRAEINVEVALNRLIITGNSVERGTFKTKLRLTDDLDAAGVSATLADGVLTIKARKVRPPAGTKIPIT